MNADNNNDAVQRHPSPITTTTTNATTDTQKHIDPHINNDALTVSITNPTPSITATNRSLAHDTTNTTVSKDQQQQQNTTATTTTTATTANPSLDTTALTNGGNRINSNDDADAAALAMALADVANATQNNNNNNTNDNNNNTNTTNDNNNNNNDTTNNNNTNNEDDNVDLLRPVQKGPFKGLTHDGAASWRAQLQVRPGAFIDAGADAPPPNKYVNMCGPCCDSPAEAALLWDIMSIWRARKYGNKIPDRTALNFDPVDIKRIAPHVMSEMERCLTVDDMRSLGRHLFVTGEFKKVIHPEVFVDCREHYAQSGGGVSVGGNATNTNNNSNSNNNGGSSSVLGGASKSAINNTTVHNTSLLAANRLKRDAVKSTGRERRKKKGRYGSYDDDDDEYEEYEEEEDDDGDYYGNAYNRTSTQQYYNNNATTTTAQQYTAARPPAAVQQQPYPQLNNPINYYQQQPQQQQYYYPPTTHPSAHHSTAYHPTHDYTTAQHQSTTQHGYRGIWPVGKDQTLWRGQLPLCIDRNGRPVHPQSYGAQRSMLILPSCRTKEEAAVCFDLAQKWKATKLNQPYPEEKYNSDIVRYNMVDERLMRVIYTAESVGDAKALFKNLLDGGEIYRLARPLMLTAEHNGGISGGIGGSIPTIHSRSVGGVGVGQPYHTMKNAQYQQQQQQSYRQQYPSSAPSYSGYPHHQQQQQHGYYTSSSRPSVPPVIPSHHHHQQQSSLHALLEAAAQLPGGTHDDDDDTKHAMHAVHSTSPRAQHHHHHPSMPTTTNNTITNNNRAISTINAQQQHHHHHSPSPPTTTAVTPTAATATTTNTTTTTTATNNNASSISDTDINAAMHKLLTLHGVANLSQSELLSFTQLFVQVQDCRHWILHALKNLILSGNIDAAVAFIKASLPNDKVKDEGDR